jgi:HSP20 family protein
MSNLVRWNPIREIQEMNEAVDRFFNDPWAAGLRGMRDGERQRAWRMPMDAYMTDDAIVIAMELPGVREDDVNVTLENNVLTISGELKPRETEQNYLLRERPAGHFERTLSVSTPVDVAKANAVFADGVLTLTLPKAEQVKPKTITVKKK